VTAHTDAHAKAGPASTRSALRVIDLGLIAYAEAFDLQRAHREEVLESRQAGAPEPGRLLLLEHDPPVITVSKRRGAREHILADPQRLAALGVQVADTDRGGDITYHGPGQLVAYPILDLNLLGLNLHGYMRALERIVIDVCAGFGVPAMRDPEATGVWVQGDAPAKICAMGVRVGRGVSTHGLALNVTTELDHFSLIVPCGLAGRPVTSLARELGDDAPSIDEAKSALASRFQAEVSERLADVG